MKTKTLLILLGIAAIIVIIFVVSKNSIKNPDDTGTVVETPVVTPVKQPVVTAPITTPVTPTNPAFPTTGFEPKN